MTLRLAALLPVLVLVGCAETDILKYQGRPAMSALECQSAYEAAKDRSASIPGSYTSGASALGTALGKGISAGMIESSYKTCLSRVAGLPPGTSAGTVAPDAGLPASRVVVRRPQPDFTAGCRPGGNVMQGGSGYCLAE